MMEPLVKLSEVQELIDLMEDRNQYYTDSASYEKLDQEVKKKKAAMGLKVITRDE